VSKGNHLTKSLSASELDRARSVACRIFEDLGFSVDRYASTRETPEEEVMTNAIRNDIESFVLGVPSEVNVRVTDKPNGFMFTLLF